MAYKQITGAVVVLSLGLLLGLIFSEGALAQADRDGDRTEGQISFGFDGQNYSTGRTLSLIHI